MMMSTKDPYNPNPNPRKTYIGNRSSVSYNIISNEKEDINLKIPKDIDKNRINFKSISISKYFDLKRPYSMHFNKQYKRHIWKIHLFLEFIKDFFQECMIIL